MNDDAESLILLRMDAYAHENYYGRGLEGCLADNRALLAGFRKDALRDAARWLRTESYRVEASGRGWGTAAAKIDPDHASSHGIISYWNKDGKE